MSLYDPFMSKGQCFYEDNMPAADSYIPCGNSEIGGFSCCQNGDICLEHGACFNAESKLGSIHVVLLLKCPT